MSRNVATMGGVLGSLAPGASRTCLMTIGSIKLVNARHVGGL